MKKSKIIPVEVSPNEIDMVALAAHIDKLKGYQKGKLMDIEIKEKLDAEVKFWEKKLKG